MDNQTYALSILKQAREILVNRLIENIVESSDEILEDAEGCSYADEIDALQDKIGGRLNNINLMIANFPAGDPSAKEPERTVQSDQVSSGALAETPAPKPEKFALFSQQIAADDIRAAGQTLSELLDVDLKLAIQCAESFRDRLNEDPTTIQKAMLLRAKLLAGKNNDSLMILWECFRLQGLQAVKVLQTLKISLAAA